MRPARAAPVLRRPPSPFLPRRPVWPALVAALAIAALLLSFGEVVRGAVRQGELRRQATAAQGGAASRCNALQGARQQERCLTLLSAQPLAEPQRSGPDAVTVATGGPAGR